MSTPAKVQLFIPCLVDQFYPKTGLATVELLKQYDIEVIYPEKQTCCGQPVFNSGFHNDATKLAMKFINDFSADLPIVSPSASCVSMVRNHYEKFDLSKEQFEKWSFLKNQIFELGEFLVDFCSIKKIEGRFEHRVAYHPSCHGLRELNIFNQPRQLLESIDQLELVDLGDREACCGFGGTFSAKFPELSVEIGLDKIRAVEESGADILTATDDSCLMHLAGIIEKRNSPIKVMHYSRILAGGEYLL